MVSSLFWFIRHFSCVLSLMEWWTATRSAVRTPQTQSLGLFCLAWNNHLLVRVEKGKLFPYGSPWLGLEYSSAYRLGFFHYINSGFFSTPLEALHFLSWQGRTLAIWRIFTVGIDQKIGCYSPENYSAEILPKMSYYIGNKFYIGDQEVIILYLSQTHCATIICHR